MQSDAAVCGRLIACRRRICVPPFKRALVVSCTVSAGGVHPADSATMRVGRFFHEMEGRWGRKASLECLAVFVPGCAGSARRHWFVHLGWWCA